MKSKRQTKQRFLRFLHACQALCATGLANRYRPMSRGLPVLL
jgi:hypothetical protein